MRIHGESYFDVTVTKRSENSRITMNELGEKVYLTGQAPSDSVVKLEGNGVIEDLPLK